MAGENLIDLVPESGGLLRPTCGGGPANTAVACARRGIPIGLIGPVGGDVFGQKTWERFVRTGVKRTYLQRTDLPTSMALAMVDDKGQAIYDFWTTGTAAFAWEGTEPPRADQDDIDSIHFGSLAAYLEPSASIIENWINRSRQHVPISFDPNIRLAAMGEIEKVRERTERLVGLSHIVRASEDDLVTLYPTETIKSIAQRWLEAGPHLVVVSLGSSGAVAFHRKFTLTEAAPQVRVADTIGAGDAFTSGLLGWLTSAGWMSLDRTGAWGNPTVVQAALKYACHVAAEACLVPGAP
ncbi:carbohydrate kinase family protein [Natronoglycomyces albus]|uniref:carbohydrate kinase family protein n=1 Tax=Natronoglycomyces albus TaxID=2811108 RepID=UPI001FEAE230|nr:carbohydrate kinase [Natronoglycomyces albus]